MNKWIGVGRLTRAIELQHLPSGGAVAKTGFVTSKKWKDKLTGEQKEEVMFIDLVFWGKGAEIANQYLAKGKKVLVEGALKLENWTDKDGQKRSKHIVTVENFEMLDSKSDNQESSEEEPQQEPDDIMRTDITIGEPKAAKKPSIELDSDIPF